MKSTVMEFTGYKIKNLTYTKTEVPPLEGMSLDEDGNGMQLNIKVGVSEDNRQGILDLRIEIFNNSNNLFLLLELAGQFDLSEDLSPQEIEDYLSMNGTAILFPYLRSIVSIITTLDSSEAMILPTINAAVFKNLDIENDEN